MLWRHFVPQRPCTQASRLQTVTKRDDVTNLRLSSRDVPSVIGQIVADYLDVRFRLDVRLRVLSEL
jgi:hypothetical protein